jgi:hypothetical protein
MPLTLGKKGVDPNPCRKVIHQQNWRGGRKIPPFRNRAPLFAPAAQFFTGFRADSLA